MIKIKIIAIIFCFLYSFSIFSQQQILLDKPVRAGELILFPDLSDNSKYYYLPDKPRLAIHNDGKPQFSFLRYVKNEKTAADLNTAISESAVGGGIVHALVELKVSDEMLKDAERALRRIDGDGKIIGPVVFKSGTVALISSIAQENGEFSKKIIGLGNAPVLENQRSAVSVQLNKLGSKILWETFATPTPDFSFQFEMEVEGYLSPKRVKIEANFDRMYKHKAFEAAMATPVLSAEIKVAMDDLFDSGAIKVTQIGEDEGLNKLKESAYNQLISLMFDKVGGTGVPQLSQIGGANSKSMLDRATENLTAARKEARDENARLDSREDQQMRSENNVRVNVRPRADERRRSAGLEPVERPTGKQAREQPSSDENSSQSPPAKREPIPSLAVAVSYQMKTVRRRGKYVIDLNKYSSTVRSMPFTYNPGNVKKQCPDCFREANVSDPFMKQREVTVSLGGINNNDFLHINFVDVIMRKKHQDGFETVEEVKIDKSAFNQTGNFFKMVYGWHGDDKRGKWLDFEYRALWSFAGGHQVKTDWQDTEFASLAMDPPLVKKPIYIEVDEDFVLDENVKGVEIKVYTKLGEKEKVTTTNLKTIRRGNVELSKVIEVLLPRDVEDYEYEITYFIKRQSPKTTARISSNYGRIDIDQFLNK